MKRTRTIDTPVLRASRKRLAWLDELLAMSREQRRARGIKASKLDIITERETVAYAVERMEDTSGGAFPNEPA